jgi:alpha-ketoglutaric semialdehyde dehydrogenase
MKQYANLIGGQWICGDSASLNINPSNTSDVIGEYAQASVSDVAAAISAARQAFPAWSRGSIQERSEALFRIGNEILARTDELADLLSREEGKVLREAKGEVVRAGNLFRFFAGEVVRGGGEKLPSIRPGVEIEISREPVGVITLITPWNFPIAIPAWKIAPALAYGNCVVFKPADLVPGSAWVLADIIHRSGIPAGVFNLVMGRGSVLGDALLAGTDAISFTGSEGVGTALLRKAVANGQKIQLEMGGKNPLVVLDDADIHTAVQCALDGSFFSTGQRCTASSRLVVTEGIHDQFVDAMHTAMSQLTVGDARDQATIIGPVVDERQLATDLSYIDTAKAEGAILLAGGERLERSAPGFYLSPALFTGCTNEMRIAREEVFGPIAAVIKVADYDEALQVANDTGFGLCAGICTTSLSRASHFRRSAQVGMVMVNLPTAGVDYHVPFGGRKGSSYGPREQGSYAAEFFTSVKTAYINAGY